jgi:hypothetical protein
VKGTKPFLGPCPRSTDSDSHRSGGQLSVFEYETLAFVATFEVVSKMLQPLSSPSSVKMYLHMFERGLDIVRCPPYEKVSEETISSL